MGSDGALGNFADDCETAHAELVRIAKQPETIARLESDGSQPIGSTPEEYAAHIKSELERWTKVIKGAGIKME